jgi:hypothetical protein
MFDVYTTGDMAHVAMVGHSVYVPPLPHDFADLKARIIAAVKNIDAPMLMHVWQELEYRIDVCCHPWCTHRTSLVVKKKLVQIYCGSEQFH